LRPDFAELARHLPELYPDHGGQAMRSDRPLLVPSRDVTVTWTVQPQAGGAASEMTESYSATLTKKRDDFGPDIYWITDLDQDRISVVLGQRQMVYAGSAALRLGTVLPNETAFWRGQTETAMGVRCTNWHIAAPDGYQADACMTDDGVPLHLADHVRRLSATKVVYGKLDPQLFAVPAAFQRIDIPPLGPTHDATVTYRGENIASDQLREDVFARQATVHIAATMRAVRFEANDSAYELVDDVAHRVTHVDTAGRTYRQEPLAGDRPALLYLYGWPIRRVGKFTFSRGDATMIAGVSCTTWHVSDADNAPRFDACISDDGLVLRLAGAVKPGEAMEATSVRYGPPPASLFTVPADFREQK
jgi:hypothetical protein